MAIDILNGKIRVYNYSLSPISFPSSHNINGVFIRGRDEDEEFVVERVAWDDIEIENTKSDIFKVGRLRFHPDEEDEIYKKLGIEDRENIISDEELVKILQDDSVENIKWISKIKSVTLLQRMKSMLFRMERSGNDANRTVITVVNERLNELKYGLRRTENSTINQILEVDRKKQEESKLFNKLEKLSKKVEELEKEKQEKENLLIQSQSAIEQLLKKVEELTKTETEKKETVPTTKKETKKKPGRPPKKE